MNIYEHILKTIEPGMLAHAYNYSIWEAEEIVGSRPTCDTRLDHLRETTCDTRL